MFVTKKSPAAAHVPSGHGSGGVAAAARRDGAGVHRAGASAGAAAHAVRRDLRAQRRHHGAVDPRARRRRVRLQADPQADRGVQGPDGGGVEPDPVASGQPGGRPRRERRRIPDRRVAEAHRGRGRARQHHASIRSWRSRSVRTRRSPRSRSPPRTSPATSAPARLASTAPTSTPCRGARPRRRCRWTSTRGWCSSGCSARPGARRSARRASATSAACSTRSRPRRGSCSAASASATASG